jgi:hypothetical protein
MLCAIAVALYFFGAYEPSFWIVSLSLGNGLLGWARATLNSDWYVQKRMAAGLEVDLFRPLRGLHYTKLASTLVLAACSYAAGSKAGYF